MISFCVFVARLLSVRVKGTESIRRAHSGYWPPPATPRPQVSSCPRRPRDQIPRVHLYPNRPRQSGDHPPPPPTTDHSQLTTDKAFRFVDSPYLLSPQTARERNRSPPRPPIHPENPTASQSPQSPVRHHPSPLPPRLQWRTVPLPASTHRRDPPDPAHRSRETHSEILASNSLTPPVVGFVPCEAFLEVPPVALGLTYSPAVMTSRGSSPIAFTSCFLSLPFSLCRTIPHPSTSFGAAVSVDVPGHQPVAISK